MIRTNIHLISFELQKLTELMGHHIELHLKIVDLAGGEVGRWGDGRKEKVLLWPQFDIKLQGDHFKK
jgi:hypothetical protein